MHFHKWLTETVGKELDTTLKQTPYATYVRHDQEVTEFCPRCGRRRTMLCMPLTLPLGYGMRFEWIPKPVGPAPQGGEDAKRGA